MTLGIEGSGPYGKIRSLRTEVRQFKYELGLIAEGMRRPLGKKRLEFLIKKNKEEIKKILDEEKRIKEVKDA